MQKNTAIRLNVIEKPPGRKGCAVIPKRRVVERSIAWAGRNRLASKEYNRNPESSEAFLYLGSIAMLLSRLYPACSFLITLLRHTRETNLYLQSCRMRVFVIACGATRISIIESHIQLLRERKRRVFL